MKKIAMLHTSSATLAMMQQLIADIMPEVEAMHLVEESMIKQVMKAGGVTPNIAARIADYVHIAEKADCDIFITACSSIGTAVEQCQFLTPLQLARIDSAMVKEAIEKGERIAVLATVATTLKPTLDYVQRKIQESGKPRAVTPILMEEAFHALLAGEMDTHDRIVADGLKTAFSQADVVMLAQASMARVLQQLPTPPVPVLTSPESGIRWLKALAES
ncbi:aspartate/glutamate racemase family protein [Klebsiella pasteurii]|uniref:Aspartate/glutamate racemase family protein n=1 Tax=Klebsiella pasteurii TaxID=2587529 RepID=A0ABD5HBR1_9ENTR|nr:aspartate/glutamate racemase family protein [Klebsiella pasteurii]MBG2717463.1 Asp/Glu racemase [Klebsiella michiganensis]MDC0691234.1 aspartate/glutamate racemase family protein [Klebsiella pasteurii]MDC0753839.1 aspartate/glutamate racemase family protein [Klebsiella pasteurii]MDQ2167032.1 aspartate/glutamate racemase family protein [Klebsiella pasteurii]MDQ2198739.1 aspartate/glutamate racemase family protein [Klebsiella pasteurii]